MTRMIIAKWMKDYENDEGMRYCITIKGSDEPLGSIDVVNVDDDVPEVGYCIARKCWNKGYMTECCTAFVKALFENGYDKVCICAFKENIASNRVIQKCGFKYTKKFIYTRAADPIELFADGGLHKQYPVVPTETVSTIGAGDNFNAGFIFGLIRYHITRSDIERGLSEQQWDAAIQSGLSFSAEVCRSLYNYVSPEFGKKRKQELGVNSQELKFDF